MRRLTEHALRPLCGDAWGIAAGFDLTHPLFEYPANLTGRVTPMLVERWEAGDESMFDGLTSWNQVAEDALEDAVGDLRRTVGGMRRWRWGRLHTLAPASPAGGASHAAPAAQRAGHHRRRQRRHGDGHRVRVPAPISPPGSSLRRGARSSTSATGTNDSTGVLYPGQSGHRFSRHHHDLSKPWARNRQFPLRWGDAAFRGRRALRLVPRERGLIATQSRI